MRHIAFLGISVVLFQVTISASVSASPNDMSRRPICSSFAKYTQKWAASARKQKCDIKRLGGKPNIGSDEATYYKWCMGTSDADFRSRSAQALGYKAVVEKGCSSQLKRKVKL